MHRSIIAKFKTDGLQVISRMRKDIRNSTRLELSDFTHILSGFLGGKD